MNHIFDLEVEPSIFDVAPLNVVDTVGDWLKTCKTLRVDDDSSYRTLTGIYAKAREWKKLIEAKRKQLVEPFRKQQSAINDKAKELSDPLDQVIAIANQRANTYLAVLEQKKAEEDEKLRVEASLFDAQDDIYIPPMENIVRGDGAVLVTKLEKQFKVVDLSKIPLKYLMVDETAVKQDLKLGVGEIPGLEIWEQKTTQLRTR